MTKMGKHNYKCLQPLYLRTDTNLELNTATRPHKPMCTTSEIPRCLFVCISNTSLFVWKLVKHLITSFRGRKRRNIVGWLKWIILREGKNWGLKREKRRGRLSSNRWFFSQRAPRGFVLSDLKWRPAAQTWVLWLHIKPFNHREPCSTKKPLMRSLPRMNKQPLMKRARALSLCEV